MVRNIKFIAEFTTNHMGNLNILLEMVKMASWAGADYIKMQKKDVKSFYSKKKLDSEFISPYGKTYYDYRKIFEFNERDFNVFDEECKKYNIKWFATAQDVNSLDFLKKYNLDAYKIASCNANKESLLKYFSEEISEDSTVVISIAGLSIAEIENTLNFFPRHNVLLNHCVAEYPCKEENLKLGNIKELKSRFGDERIKIGYSGHEIGTNATLYACDLGATFVERHFCLSRHSFVHHIECSLEPNEFKLMVESINSAHNSPSLKKKINPLALESNFGMSEKEKSFLVDNTYGKSNLEDPSRFYKK